MSIFVDTPARASRIVTSVTEALITTRIISGSLTMGTGYELDEDGGYALDEDGNKILLEAPAYELNENGTYALDEDGNRILIEGSNSFSPQYELNEDGSYALSEEGNRILLENSNSYTITALPLLESPTECLYVNVVAKPRNFGPVWVSGLDAADGVGIPIYARGSPLYVPINDVNKIHIWCDVGDGVNFFYGVAVVGDGFLRDNSGNLVLDDDGNQVSG